MPAKCLATIIAALALLTGCIRPAPANKLDWRYWRHRYLTDKKDVLSIECYVSKELNRQGRSSWSKELREGSRKAVMGKGISEKQWEALDQGLRAAMKKACPEVW